MTKTAVILFNLGGPDSRESIEPFLMNFFTDPNIIGLPFPLRWLLAKFISYRRSRREAADSYHELGDRSPLLENSRAQAGALEAALGTDYRVFVCMRYWHPMAGEVAAAVREWGAQDVVLIPLYPQFSTTTTWSSLGEWRRAAHSAGLEAPTATLCCYPFNEGFIRASADRVRDALECARSEGHGAPRVLFSAHGLPEKIIAGGDPYQWQCEQTAQKIVEALGVDDLEWLVSYQSRVGPMKWIGPSTEEEIRRAGADGRALVIYPHAFTQEHVETLVELDIEYAELAHEAGVPGYYRAMTVADHPAFIAGLAALVRERQARKGLSAEGGAALCPGNFSRCCMRATT